MSDKKNDFILKLIDNRGLFDALRILNLTFTEILSFGFNLEILNRKMKQEFIQDYFKYLGYGIGLSEIDEDPIIYSNNEDELKLIVYLGTQKAIVEVWGGHKYETHQGEFGVSYYNLSDDMIDEIFEIVVQLYDNDVYI